MNQAAESLLGEHDFRGFGRALSENGTTVRHITEAAWEKTGENEMEFYITGNAFLYHMVRRIVYVLVKVGNIDVPVSIIQTGLQTGNTGIAALAPARGLTLVEVKYAEDKN